MESTHEHELKMSISAIHIVFMADPSGWAAKKMHTAATHAILFSCYCNTPALTLASLACSYSAYYWLASKFFADCSGQYSPGVDHL
jgi:hypothetical protein